MRFKSKLIAIALAISVAAGTSPAQALPMMPGGTFQSFGQVSTGGGFATPLGFQIFCLKSPEYCKPVSSVRVNMTADVLTHLERINRQVNGAIRPQVRRTQVWELGARVGDCKDYAMNKWSRLIANGFPPGALRLAIGYTARGEGHAVLIIRTSAGDLVLDNLTNSVLPVSQVTHRLIAMSSSNPRQWTAIS